MLAAEGAALGYFNEHRGHQGIGGVPRDGPGLPRAAASGDVVVEEFLDGLHRSYRRAA